MVKNIARVIAGIIAIAALTGIIAPSANAATSDSTDTLIDNLETSICVALDDNPTISGVTETAESLMAGRATPDLAGTELVAAATGYCPRNMPEVMAFGHLYGDK